MQTKTFKKLSSAELTSLADTSAYTIIGAGGDIQEWVNETRFSHGRRCDRSASVAFLLTPWELGDEAENRKTWPFFTVFGNVFAIPKKIFVDPLEVFMKMSNHCHRATEGWVRIT